MHRTDRIPHGLLVAMMIGLAYGVLSGSALGAAENTQPALFAAPEEAVAAFSKAVQAEDLDGMRQILGPAMDEIANPDQAQRDHYLAVFAKHVAEGITPHNKDDHTVVLMVGQKNWPFPIPLVKKNGQWFFDTQAGKEEILNRRIGHDELMAIDVCRAYVQAQREYALKDRNCDGVMEYAQKLLSTAGAQDGLYWESNPGEEQSPFGPLVARAQARGYKDAGDSAGVLQTEPFHGYYFRILTRQGRHAPGGKYNYVINAHMVAGFALLAYPAVWGNSGVMTFIVNQQGKVCQKDLGTKTARLAQELREYDPDTTWEPVK